MRDLAKGRHWSVVEVRVAGRVERWLCGVAGRMTVHIIPADVDRADLAKLVASLDGAGSWGKVSVGAIRSAVLSAGGDWRA
jgi:hypothetical protein